MKIVFLNVWGIEMQDSLIGYLEEQARDTDIFCFQESTESMKRRCADVLSDYAEFSERKYVSENDIFDQAIFVKKNIDVLNSGVLMAENMDCGLANFIEARLTGGGRMFVCSMHGKARPGDKLDDAGRLKQSETLIEHFASSTIPVIIGGDFNVSPDTKSIEMFSQHGYRDLIKEFAIDTTRNHLAWDRYEVKMMYSDYVFLNNNVKLKRFSVTKNEVSDHLPMLLEIES